MADGSRRPPVGEDPARGDPVNGVLRVGARGLERAAHATRIDRALNQAAEEAILRALRSPAVIRALARAADGHDLSEEWSAEEVSRLLNRVLASDVAADAWREFLRSDQAQMLVERIAGAPEIRAAIASQSAGLITDIGVRLTILTEQLDDTLERLTRPNDPDAETDQAGLATRLVAAGIDLGLIFGGYALFSSAIASVTSTIFGRPPSLLGVIVLSLLGLILGGGFFAMFWTLAGQTPGMRFLSIRVVYDGSRELSFGRAVRRVLALVVSLLPLGLGYFSMLRDPHRRGWHDRWTNTEVVYDLVTRTAPHKGSAAISAAAARHRRGGKSRLAARPGRTRGTKR